MSTDFIFNKQTTTTSKMPDSLLNAPELYVSELPFGIGDEELKKTFKDVEPIEVNIHRQFGGNGNNLNGVIRFSSIENAEKAFAIYNNIKLEAYKCYLKLQITDPANRVNEPQAFAIILQVKSLPSTTTNFTLYDLFRRFGPLFSARMQYHDNSNKYKGYSLVQFFSQEDADRASAEMNYQMIDGRNISVTQYIKQNNNKPVARPNLSNLTMPGIASFSPPGNNFNNIQQAPSSPGPEGPIVDPCNLFIKNLDANISSSDLFNHFRRFGRIISARVMRDQETGNSKGFGFVSYTSAEEADRAKASMHGKTLGNKQIVVRLHEPKKLREAKLANQYSNPTSPSESRAPSRRNSDLFIINSVNEFGREDLAGLAPKARKEVLMSELQKRFKNIPSIPPEEVNPIIDHLLNMKVDDVLHILKDANSLQQKITEARHHLQQDNKRRGSGDVLVAPVQSISSSNSFQPQIPQREKFLKAINKLGLRNADDILEFIMFLNQKERALCYFNPEYLTKKILEANQAIATVHEDDNNIPKVLVPTDVPAPTSPAPSLSRTVAPSTVKIAVAAETPSGVHSAAYEEIEQFIESLKNKPINEQKQKLGSRLFPLVKNLGLKSATASKVTINLLDTDDLRELAHSMNEPEKFKQKVSIAEKMILSAK